MCSICSMCSMCSVCWWFIYQNWEPLEKVCCGMDMHALNRLPPVCDCLLSVGHMQFNPFGNNNMVPLPDGGVSMSAHTKFAMPARFPEGPNY